MALSFSIYLQLFTLLINPYNLNNTTLIANCPESSLVYNIQFYSCMATFEVPLPTISNNDNCTYEVETEIITLEEIEVLDSNGQVISINYDTLSLGFVPWNSTSRLFSDCPVGEHFFRYLITDDCNNFEELFCPFTVIDIQEPEISCEDDRIVQISSVGVTRLFTDVFIDDVYDNCGIDRIQIRRNGFDPINNTCGNSFSLWGDYADFFCCEVGDTFDIQARIIDTHGNIGNCFSIAIVLDNESPNCVAPPAVSISCNDISESIDWDDFNTLENMFGQANVTDNCDANIQEITPIIELNNCQLGTVIRRFVATDGSGMNSDSCTQNINILPYSDFSIRFPTDNNQVICDIPTETPEILNAGCDTLDWYFEDIYFDATEEECFKIFRTYYLSTPCTSDSNSNIHVIGRDENCDNLPGNENVWVHISPEHIIYIDKDDNPNNNIPNASENICQDTAGYWRSIYYQTGDRFQYTQIIKVYEENTLSLDFQSPDTFCLSPSTNCDGLAEVRFKLNEACYENFPEAVGSPDVMLFLDEGADGSIDRPLEDSEWSEDNLNYEVNLSLETGHYVLHIVLTTSCGLDTTIFHPFYAGADCISPPTPLCNSGALEPHIFDENNDGIPDSDNFFIRATDLITDGLSDEDSCHPSDLLFSIHQVGDIPSTYDSILVLTCDDIYYNNPMMVEVYTWDEVGNNSSCATFVLLQPPFLCEPPLVPAIQGNIFKDDFSPVDDILVNLSFSGDIIETASSENGFYVFNDVVPNLTYNLELSSNEDFLNGVSTFDLVLLSQHILGTTPLNSPYKRIAADVNNSQSITTLDMISIRKLLLGIDLSLPNGTPSWRFVDADYIFPNPLNPWQEPFPQSATILNFSGVLVDQNFIAIKMGDMNLDSE